MTICEARKMNIPTRDILAYDMSDEEKLMYVFERNKEAIREFSSTLYYILLAMDDKYKERDCGNYFVNNPD